MPNYYGRMGAPMIQPTKDEIRGWLSEAREELKTERSLRHYAEKRLNAATYKLGLLVLEGKLEIPVEKLGALAVDLAVEERDEARFKALQERVEARKQEREKLLVES
jgi:hypothetical protein